MHVAAATYICADVKSEQEELLEHTREQTKRLFVLLQLCNCPQFWQSIIWNDAVEPFMHFNYAANFCVHADSGVPCHKHAEEQ